MTESDLTRLVKRVIQEQASADPSQALKSELLNKKVSLFATASATEPMTTFMIKDIKVDGDRAVLSGLDLNHVDARGNAVSVPAGTHVIKSIIFTCKRLNGFAATTEKSRGEQGFTPDRMMVFSKNLSAKLKDLMNCEPDIDKTPDFQP